MSHRASGSQAVASPQWSATTSGDTSAQQQHGDELHIMPSSLRRIPEWYQASRFQYNARLMVGVAPGLFLLLTVTGKTMFGAIVAGIFLTMFIRYLQQSWMSMALSVGHVIVLEVVNVYCMTPLIWRSIFNLPLYGLFHIFIGLAGIFWWLQDDELLRQEPRFTILLERVLFCLCPPLFVTMVTWIAGILFGKSVLPFVVVAAGFLAFSLFLVPLQSSFAKPNTPANTGLIQHRVVVWLYSFLLLTVPALMFTAITYQHSVQFYLMLGLLVCSPVCLLSLLEAQGLGEWFMTGSWSGLLQYVRMLSASVIILLVSGCVLLTQPSSFLPYLLLPILFVTVGLASIADHASLSSWTLAMGGVLALLYGAAFTQLPWSIKYASKFLSLPLTLVQLLLWGVALAAAALMTFWSKATPTLLITYNAVFILCEFILSSDSVYPHYFAFITGSVAIFTFWRLHSISKLNLNVSLAVMCLHLTKLSLLYPCEHSPSTLTSAVLPLCSTFLTSFVLLRLLLFDHTPSLTWSQLLSYSGLLFVGLLLSVDTFVSPLWASLTHTLPSSASLLAFVLGTVAMYVSYGCSLLGSQEKPPLCLTSLPPGLAVMAAFLAFLQPQFSIYELMESLLAITGDKTYLPDDSYLLAWTNLLTWLILFSMLFALIQLVFPQWPAMTPISVSFLGVLAGFHFSISLAESPPGTLESLLYASVLGVGGALCGRAFTGRHKMKWIDTILFISLCIVSVLTYSMEWRSKDPVFVPGLSLLERYSLPSTLVIAMSFLCVAISFRLGMHWSGKEEPYLPMLGNMACLAFFLTAPLQKFSQESEITVLFCSLVFLLSQPDGYLRPKTSHFFFAPSLLFSLVILYIMALTNVFAFFLNHMYRAPQIIMAGRIAELIFLFLSMPGQAVFLQSLWLEQYTLPSLSGSSFSSNRIMLLLFLLPSGFLPQFSSTLATSIVGSIGIFSFCLAVISNSKLNVFQ